MNGTGEKVNGLRIGWAIADITPAGPASLYGQYYERISQYVESPLQVTACCIESVQEGRTEVAIMVSMDLLCPLTALQEALRARLREAAPAIDGQKVFLNATHTHSAPYPDVTTEYGKFLLSRLCEVAIGAWGSRATAGVSWGLEYAVTGHNRRVRYADGTAEMYGDMNRPDCIGLEGPADPGISMVFCWGAAGELTGILLNAATPAQVVEAKYFVSADYWCAAAGDISPRDLSRGYSSGEPNMWDTPGIKEIGERIFLSVMRAYPEAKRT